MIYVVARGLVSSETFLGLNKEVRLIWEICDFPSLAHYSVFGCLHLALAKREGEKSIQ